MPQVTCQELVGSRRRVFWATQPNGCATYTNACGEQCGVPGLTPIELEAGKTIANSAWVRGLLLNIFNTRARDPNSNCGLVPGSQGGHWSESYSDIINSYVGTFIYSQTERTVTSIRDAIKLINAIVTKDAQKLVTYGVATSVTVETEYKGRNHIAVTIKVQGPRVTAGILDGTLDPDNIDGVINLSATRLNNAWVWA